MNAWPPLQQLQKIDRVHLGPLTPVEVLYEFEGPCIFTASTPAGATVIAYLCETLEAQGWLRYLVASTSASTLDALKRGALSVRDALERGSLWLVDFDARMCPQHAFAIEAHALPADALPAPNTMLWPSLEPAFIVKLEGTDISPGMLPPGALAQAADIASKALKPVFEWAARACLADDGARLPEWLRLLYGLPTQRLGHGSLEIAFRAVDLPVVQQGSLPLSPQSSVSPQQIQDEAWRAIRQGLTWASTTAPTAPESDNEDKWLAVLETLRRLAPPTSGPVTAVSLSGRLLGEPSVPFHLDRSASRTIRATLTGLRRRHDALLRLFRGRIRDLDLDRLSLILRGVPDEASDILVTLDHEQLLEVAREAHYQELEVKVVARSTDGRNWIATELEFAAPYADIPSETTPWGASGGQGAP